MRFVSDGLLHLEALFVRTERLGNRLLLQLFRDRTVVLDLAVEHLLVQSSNILVAQVLNFFLAIGTALLVTFGSLQLDSRQ